jgi:hypothetical protein
MEDRDNHTSGCDSDLEGRDSHAIGSDGLVNSRAEQSMTKDNDGCD